MADPISFARDNAPWRMDRGLRGRRDGVMRGTLTHIVGCGGLGALMVMALCGPAHAVDILNKDKVPRMVAINDSTGDSRGVTVPAKQTLPNVCKSCVVLMDDTSVEAEGNVTVVVERGKVSIAKK